MPADANGHGVGKSKNHKTTQRSKTANVTSKDGSKAWTTWLWLLPVVTLLPWYLSKLHYRLPEPLPPLDSLGRPQPSEQNVLKHIQALEDAGYRVVGTEEALRGEEYVMDQVRLLETKCNGGGVLKCDVWLQKGSGYHAFDIMDHEVLKVYGGISNVILRISSKRPPSGKIINDALLLGSHIDSTLPAPGAADDGIGVGVMLDIARILVDRNQPFDGNVLFLWNGAEETLQDGSHLYSTQHETAKDVKAVINLEAAGTTGGALLFQATSKQMIEAYSHVPYPRGSVIAADVFASGIMISDTDFVQFEKYLNVSGLDMALVGHSYFYHTRKDRIEHIERGSAQHFADNAMAVVDFMTSPSSPLLSDKPWDPPDMVYMSLFDSVYWTWGMDTADKIYMAMAAVMTAFTIANVNGHWRAFGIAILGTPIGIVAGIGASVLVAVLMDAMDKRQTWFWHEHICLFLFTPIALAANFAVQMLLSLCISSRSRKHLETVHYSAQLGYCTLYMLLLQFFRIRSAYIFTFISGVVFFGAVSQFLTRGKGQSHFATIFGYAVPMIPLTAFAIEAFTTSLDIFVPLTGRMGKAAPSEIIIAIISSACPFIFVPILTPLFFKYSRSAQRAVILILSFLSVLAIIVFSGPWWPTYDPMHPQRLGLEYLYNHTSGAHTMQIGFMDLGPRRRIVENLHERYGAGPVEHFALTDYDSDWDIMYPVSSFLDTYRFPLPRVDFTWPKLDWRVQESFTTDHRKIHLRLNYTGLVWPTLAFDADIEEWSYDFPPPQGMKRHHIKIAASADDPVVHLNMVLRNKSPIRMHWSAVDGNQLVPHTAARKGANMPAGKLLLDLDQFIDDTYKGSVDAVMGGIVTGVIEV